jgi:hypothetical protein
MPCLKHVWCADAEPAKYLRQSQCSPYCKQQAGRLSSAPATSYSHHDLGRPRRPRFSSQLHTRQPSLRKPQHASSRPCAGMAAQVRELEAQRPASVPAQPLARLFGTAQVVRMAAAAAQPHVTSRLHAPAPPGQAPLAQRARSSRCRRQIASASPGERQEALRAAEFRTRYPGTAVSLPHGAGNNLTGKGRARTADPGMTRSKSSHSGHRRMNQRACNAQQPTCNAQQLSASRLLGEDTTVIDVDIVAGDAGVHVATLESSRAPYAWRLAACLELSKCAVSFDLFQSCLCRPPCTWA